MRESAFYLAGRGRPQAEGRSGQWAGGIRPAGQQMALMCPEGEEAAAAGGCRRLGCPAWPPEWTSVAEAFPKPFRQAGPRAGPRRTGPGLVPRVRVLSSQLRTPPSSLPHGEPGAAGTGWCWEVAAARSPPGPRYIPATSPPRPRQHAGPHLGQARGGGRLSWWRPPPVGTGVGDTGVGSVVHTCCRAPGAALWGLPVLCTKGGGGSGEPLPPQDFPGLELVVP